jgi:siroheme synthase
VVENCSRSDEKVQLLKLGELENGLAGRSGPVLVMIGAAFAPRTEN